MQITPYSGRRHFKRLTTFLLASDSFPFTSTSRCWRAAHSMDQQHRFGQNQDDYDDTAQHHSGEGYSSVHLTLFTFRCNLLTVTP